MGPRGLVKSPLAADLTFKGGTSLSKAYQIIDRFPMAGCVQNSEPTRVDTPL